MRRVLWLAAVVIGAVAAAMPFLLPPRALGAPDGGWKDRWPIARGAYHVHSVRSDGTGTLDEIAEAAARAGLQFVILTDHGDGTRPPEPPTYRSGVLCLDGVEISTEQGHYVAVELPATPYRLGGQPRDVVEDVARFGGVGVVAHPGSPKAALRWDDWDAPVDGIEWLNADSEWRDERWSTLLRLLLAYPIRPRESLAAVLGRPDAVVARWAEIARGRRVFGLAAADAHARLSFWQTADPYEDRVIARVPSYEVSFGAFDNRVILAAPLTGDAAADARLVLDGIRDGRVFTAIGGLARLGGFALQAKSGGRKARPGEYLELDGPALIEAEIAGPPGIVLSVFRDDETIYEAATDALRLDVGTTPGAYRVEARLPEARGVSSVPWVLANPIYVGMRAAHASAPTGERARPSVERLAVAGEAMEEASQGSDSRASIDVPADGARTLVWRFRIADGAEAGQYAALSFALDGSVASHDRLLVRARAERPMRIWAQLRAPSAPQRRQPTGPQDGERWGRSFYVGPEGVDLDLPFATFRPLDAGLSGRVPLERVTALLFVVDTVNARPGTQGAVWMTDLAVGR